MGTLPEIDAAVLRELSQTSVHSLQEVDGEHQRLRLLVPPPDADTMETMLRNGIEIAARGNRSLGQVIGNLIRYKTSTNRITNPWR